ncbi:MAG: hypothetical protein JXA25_01000 [Anaerolineales bacterium]|nr:hypothetical protein [Anaerolineales bacterium]
MTIQNQVHLYTSYFTIYGEVTPGPAGMYSHMNLPTSSHLELSNADIIPLFKLSSEPVHRDRLWLVKEKVVVVVLERVSEMGTSNLSRRGFTRPFPHWVRAEVGDYELTGVLQLGGNFEFGEVISKGERNFIPLYKARLGSALYPAVNVEMPVMLFNRKWLQGMALLTPREIPEGETV